MTERDLTTRCQNCGGLRKEHGRQKPWRCATRLQESCWRPWTVQEYKDAVEAGKRAAAAQEAGK